MERRRLSTGNSAYQRRSDSWIMIFTVSFGIGGGIGMVMSFQFRTNRSVLAEKTSAIQRPLLGNETFTR